MLALKYVKRSAIWLRSACKFSSSGINITTYNVLSSKLADEDYFTSCKPEHLKASYRLGKLKLKLDEEVASSSIICLQEVSMAWAGNLHAYFAAQNYHFITGLYGKKFNGYMGVGIAVPISKFNIIGTDITRIADTKPYKHAPRATGMRKLFAVLKGIVNRVTSQPYPKLDPWKEAADKHNQLVSVRLQLKDTSNNNNSKDNKSRQPTFVVGTYHMPCMFILPSMMMIHCALASLHMKKFAREDAYVLAGDFNIKPDSSMYRLLTQGSVESNNVDLPPPGPAAGGSATGNGNSNNNWKWEVAPLQSAYKEHQGAEPAFTNYAKVREEVEFIDTLDYIFLSHKHWQVTSTRALPSRADAAPHGPMPTEGEPSDHLMLSACVQLLPLTGTKTVIETTEDKIETHTYTLAQQQVEQQQHVK